MKAEKKYLFLTQKSSSFRRSVSIVFILVAVALIIFGIVFGDLNIIFRKAVFVCLECMGIA